VSFSAGTITAVAGATTLASGHGFKNNSTVVLFIFSTATLLGTPSVNSSGAFTTSVQLPAGLSGNHTIQVQGLDVNGTLLALDLGITINAPPTPPTPPSGGGGGGGGGGSAPPVTTPNSPTGGALTISGTTLNASWSASTQTGVTYIVTATPGGLTCTTTTTSCSITGLIPGTSYTFTLVAKNSAGSSSAVTIGSATAQGAPGSVSGVKASTTGDITTISWVAPSSNGGSPITGYTVTAVPAGPTCSTTGATFCTIAGMVAGTSYIFSVVATNSVGSSSALAASVPTFALANPSLVITGKTGAVSWTTPPTSALASIMSYLVTVQPLGAQCVAKGVLTCKISGLSAGKTYQITLSAISTSGETISSVTSSTSTSTVVAKTIVLTVSQFGEKSAKLTKSQLSQILTIAKVIKSKKALKIRLDGYTDNVGTTYVNSRVAYVRVKIALAQLELDLYHLQWRKCYFSTFAHGNGPYVASNATSSGKSINRRVEFTITLP